MGQILDIMGESKDKLLYEFVINGNVEVVESLCREGVGLEWKDRDGKTPLIAACMNHCLYTVAQTLIVFGADVNAYCEGPYAGTPLHHAAARGLDTIVKLLLSHGANTSVTNDNYHTPLHVARLNRCTDVVRTIENHISYFSGWLREIHGPCFNLSRVIWAVVKPCGSNEPATPPKLQLLIYRNSQLVHKCISYVKTLIVITEATTVFDAESVSGEKQIATELKLTSAIEGDKQQIQSLYDACRGIPQGSPPPVFHDAETAAATQTDAETSDAATPSLFHVAETSDAEAAASTQTDAEAIELAMAISASIQSTAEHRPPPLPIMHHFSGCGDFFDIDSPPPLIRAAATQTDAEAIELAMAISASIQSNAKDRPPPLPNMHHFSDVLGGIFGSASHNGCGSSCRPAHLEGSPPPVFHDAETAAATQTDAETSDAATPPLFHVAETSDAEAAAATQTYAEAIELAMAISASIQSTAEHRPPPLPIMHHFSGWGDFFDIDSPPPLIRAAASNAETAAATQTDAEAIELAMAINASIQSNAKDGPPPLPNMHHFSNVLEGTFGSASHNGCGSSCRPAHLEASSSGWTWDVPGSGASSNPTLHPQTQGRILSILQSSNRILASCSSVPSAPPIPVEDDLDESLIYYPPIHSSPADLSIPAVEDGVSKASDKGNGGSSSLCVICCETPVECACVPCGHVAGCIDCLKEIKAIKGACPICRSKIDQVLKIYVV